MNDKTDAKNADFDVLKRAVEAAVQEYRATRATLETAQCRATLALNDLNRAQRHLDAAVDALKADAPIDSDWEMRKRKSEPAFESQKPRQR